MSRFEFYDLSGNFEFGVPDEDALQRFINWRTSQTGAEPGADYIVFEIDENNDIVVHESRLEMKRALRDNPRGDGPLAA